jgi:N-formylglutamate deformylase
MTREPLLISIPHGGWRVAPEVAARWALSEHDALHDGDPFTARIYDFRDRVAAQIVMEQYRAVVDLNRAPHDIAPANPDGVVKSHTCYQVEVYRPGHHPDEALQATLLERYYHPYHTWLDEQITRADVRLGIDCHSMAAVAPPIEADAGVPRPLICLGNLGDAAGRVCPPHGRVTCPPELLQLMADECARVFAHEDVEVEAPAVASMNVPFSGGYITRRVGSLGVIPFVQIEMSRALYLCRPYFDDATLAIDERRVADLNAKVWRVLVKTVRAL